MNINRFTKIVFSIVLMVTAQPFFCMASKPAVCAAAPVAAAIDDDARLKIFAWALASAIRAGDLRTVQQLLENPTDPKAPQVALILATYYNKLDIIAFLIEVAHIYVDTQITFSNYYDIDGRELTHRGDWQRTPLIIAAKNNAIDIAQYLIRQGANLNAHDGLEGKSALLVATSLEMTKFLVESGADIHATDKFGYTALHTPDFSDDIGRAKYLVAAGADIFARNNFDKTAKRSLLQLGVNAPHTRVTYLQELENKAFDKKAILYALLACKDLVAPDSVPRHGEFPPEDIGRILTPCVSGAKSNRRYTELMDYMHHDPTKIKNRAEYWYDINARDEYQYTALMHACSHIYPSEQEKLEYVQYLVKLGADIHARNMWGETALDIAQQNEYTAIAQYLQQVEKEAMTAKK